MATGSKAGFALTCVCLVALADAGQADAQPLSPQRQREVLQTALNAYDDAVAIAGTEPARAGELLREAAAAFETLRSAGVRNPAVEYNLGNTYYRLNELGRAILHYRRAEHLGSRDPQLAANLRFARRLVEPQINPSGQTRFARQLLFWHHNTTLPQRFWGFLLLTGTGWLLLFAWLLARRTNRDRSRRRPAPLVIAGSLLVLFGWCAGASVVWQLTDESRRPHAVVIVDEVYLRRGRSEGADRVLNEPLGQGVELRVLDQRDQWVEVRLANDEVGWLPAAAIARV